MIIHRKILFGLVAAAAGCLVAMSTVCKAQQSLSCEDLGGLLREVGRMGQTPRLVGILDGNDGGIPIIGFANKTTGTFTIIARPEAGKGCVALEGGGFQSIEPTEPTKPGEDS